MIKKPSFTPTLVVFGLLLLLLGSILIQDCAAPPGQRSTGGYLTLCLITALYGLYRLYKVQSRIARIDRLISTFGEETAILILDGKFWQGQHRNALLESLGPPSDIKTNVLKTKTKEEFRYLPKGRRQFGLKIFLEDNTVVGWEQ
jgi:hypothetical protein